MGYELVEAQSFWDCVQSLGREDPFRVDLFDTMLELRQQPFHNPRIQTHEVGRGTNGKHVYSSDVGGRRNDRRLIWQLFNRTVVVLLYGTHAVQDRAKRMRIAFDEGDRVVTIYEKAPDTGLERPYQEQRAQIGKLFMAWTDAELAQAGFPDATLAVLRRLDSQDELLAMADSMPDDLFEVAYNLIAHGRADGATKPDEPVVPADEPEVTEADREIERQLEDTRGGTWFTRTEPEYLKEILSRPIEDWMVFLHPDQRVIVRRNFEGPARVRGGAGTGKTVVGLHRAAWLAERRRDAPKGAPPVLFTTFIKSLPPVFQSLYMRMPGTQAGEVEFVHIDKLAAQVCIAAGNRLVTAPREIDAAFATAHKRILTLGTPLADAAFSRQYLRDEITSVIKGRGIADLDTYLAVARTGRRAPLTKAQRQQVWELKLEWDSEMFKRKTVDFPDVVLAARDIARSLPKPRYSAAIVDEAQDLSLAGLQLVRALVNAPDGVDKPNGLLLVGDGAQRIYAGGFTLRQAGLEIRGRTSVLKVNYRNTGEIIGAAMAVAGESEVEDFAEEYRRGEEASDAARHGAKPLLIQSADLSSQLEAITALVQNLTAGPTAISPGDIGVLVASNKLVEQVVARLRKERIAVQDLAAYDGRPNASVKVGTFHRGKGLEFKVAFLPALSKGVFPRPAEDGVAPEEAAEARDLAVSQLFVAMTRARDQLVLLYDGEPSDVIARAIDRFEQVST